MLQCWDASVLHGIAIGERAKNSNTHLMYVEGKPVLSSPYPIVVSESDQP
jgi:hypothetical protein